MTYKIFLLIILFCYCAEAQESTNYYIPIHLDELENYFTEIEQKKFLKIKGPNQSEITKFYKEKSGIYLESIKDSLYFFHPEIDRNIQDILDIIYNSNPEIDHKDFKFLVKNDLIPNAACYGDGVFEINLGLISILDNEDQLAFVMCHEIAHHILDHPYNSLSERIATFNSKEFKERITEIKGRQYGKTRAAMALLDQIGIELLNYSKEVEAIADSIGYLLYSNTKYDKMQSILALENLKLKNNSIFHHKIRLDSLLNFEGYPFKPVWLKREVSLFDDRAKTDDFSLAIDTLKTHPEIQYRIDKIRSIQNEVNLDYQNDGHVWALKKLADSSILKFTKDHKAYDLSLYSMNRLYKNGKLSQIEFSLLFIELLKDIYERKKIRDFGKYVPRPNALTQEKNIDDIRLFLNNIEAGEIRNLALAFINSQDDFIQNNLKFKKYSDFFVTINNNYKN